MIAIICLWVSLAVLASFCREGRIPNMRLTWLGVGLVLTEATLMPNPFLAVVVAMVPLSVLLRYDKPSEAVPTFLFPTAAFGGAYLAAIHTLTVQDVPVLLWLLTGIGLVLGLIAVYSFRYSRYGMENGEFIGHGFWHSYELPWGWKLRLFEADLRAECGQLNPIHLQGLSALSTASCTGLWWMGCLSGLALWLLMPLLLLPIWLVQYNQRVRWHPTQGLVHLAALGGAISTLVWGRYGLLGAVACGILAFPFLLRHSNGRWEAWTGMLRHAWWRQPWGVKLFGTGAGSWVHLYRDMKYQEAVDHHGQQPTNDGLFTSAHNEFVQQWVEYGILGGVGLLGYCGLSLAALLGGGAAAQAVAGCGAVALSIMFFHFPTDLYHEVIYEDAKAVQGSDKIVMEMTNFNQHGSPSLLAMFWVVAVLVEISR